SRGDPAAGHRTEPREQRAGVVAAAGTGLRRAGITAGIRAGRRGGSRRGPAGGGRDQVRRLPGPPARGNRAPAPPRGSHDPRRVRLRGRAWALGRGAAAAGAGAPAHPRPGAAYSRDDAGGDLAAAGPPGAPAPQPRGLSRPGPSGTAQALERVGHGAVERCGLLLWPRRASTRTLAASLARAAGRAPAVAARIAFARARGRLAGRVVQAPRQRNPLARDIDLQ